MKTYSKQRLSPKELRRKHKQKALKHSARQQMPREVEVGVMEYGGYLTLKAGF